MAFFGLKKKQLNVADYVIIYGIIYTVKCVIDIFFTCIFFTQLFLRWSLKLWLRQKPYIITWEKCFATRTNLNLWWRTTGPLTSSGSRTTPWVWVITIQRTINCGYDWRTKRPQTWTPRTGISTHGVTPKIIFPSRRCRPFLLWWESYRAWCHTLTGSPFSLWNMCCIRVERYTRSMRTLFTSGQYVQIKCLQCSNPVFFSILNIYKSNVFNVRTPFLFSILG